MKRTISIFFLAAMLLLNVTTTFASTGQNGDYSLNVSWVSPEAGSVISADTPITVNVDYTLPKNTRGYILLSLFGNKGDIPCKGFNGKISDHKWVGVTEESGSVQFTLNANLLGADINFVNVGAALYKDGNPTPKVSVFGCNDPILPSFTTTNAELPTTGTPAPVVALLNALEGGNVTTIQPLFAETVVYSTINGGSTWLSASDAAAQMAILPQLSADYTLSTCSTQFHGAENGTQFNCLMSMDNAWRTALGLGSYDGTFSVFVDATGKISNVSQMHDGGDYRADRAEVNQFMSWLSQLYPDVYAGLSSADSGDYIRATDDASLLQYAREWAAQ